MTGFRSSRARPSARPDARLTSRLGAWALGVALLAVGSGGPAARAATAHSRSGQFVVQSRLDTRPTLGPMSRPAGPGNLRLDPDPVAVSCERIKNIVLRTLGFSDRWRAKIHVTIQPQWPTAGDVRVVATRFADGWQIGFELPDSIERSLFARAVVEALVLELACRVPGPSGPEVPIWLVEALTREVLTTPGPDVLLEANPLTYRPGPAAGRPANWGAVAPSSREGLIQQARQDVRRALVDRPPLTFTQLSLAEPMLLSPAHREFYRACAHLLLHELLRLPNGRAALGELVGQLTRTLNWQTAFLRAFRGQFETLMDVEKWWAVTLASFLSRDELKTWSAEISRQKLDDILKVPVSFQVSADTPPVAGMMTLQQVIAEWEFAAQRPVLRERLTQLAALRGNVPPALRPLVSRYVGTLDHYLRTRGSSRPRREGKSLPVPSAVYAMRSTVERLDELDRIRRATPVGNEPVHTPFPQVDLPP